MKEPNGPILIDEHGDLELYLNKQEAADDLEAFDVENDEFEAYDMLGNVLDLRVENNRVTISFALNQSVKLTELNDKIRRLAGHIGSKRLGLGSIEEASTAVLIERLLAIR